MTARNREIETGAADTLTAETWDTSIGESTARYSGASDTNRQWKINEQ